VVETKKVKEVVFLGQKGAVGGVHVKGKSEIAQLTWEDGKEGLNKGTLGKEKTRKKPGRVEKGARLKSRGKVRGFPPLRGKTG